MAKYYGMIGYFVTGETRPGIWEESIIEHPHYGEVIKHSRRWSESSDGTNDNLTINCDISILLDTFALENYQHIKYITYMNAKWKVTNVEIEQPRIRLTLGGLYNENES